MGHDIDFYWNASVAFHGHACPGLAMGCRMAVDAAALLGVEDRKSTRLNSSHGS